MPDWPEWWAWDIEISPHLMRRMKDRRFSEVDLRSMLEDAAGYHEDYVEGRYAIETRHEERRWEVIVAPVPDETILVVVTAYPTEEES